MIMATAVRSTNADSMIFSYVLNLSIVLKLAYHLSVTDCFDFQATETNTFCKTKLSKVWITVF